MAAAPESVMHFFASATAASMLLLVSSSPSCCRLIHYCRHSAAAVAFSSPRSAVRSRNRWSSSSSSFSTTTTTTAGSLSHKNADSSSHQHSRSSSISSNLITSTKSATVKKIQALLTKRKKRVEYGQVVVEGPRMVLDLYRSTTTRSLIQQVLIDVDQFDEYAPLFSTAVNGYNTNNIDDDGADDVDDDPSSSRSVRLIPATPEVLQACTDTVCNQGILAVCNLPDWSNISHSKVDVSRRSSSMDCDPPQMYLICDAVSDPGNLGTLIRSAAACGVAAVYLLPDSCDPWNPKAVRSAMGTTFTVPVHQTESWPDCLERLERAGCRSNSIWAATMLEDNDVPASSDGVVPGDGTTSTSHYEVDWTAPQASALIIGSEGNGLTPALRQAVRDKMIRAVHVPMQSASVESLNAAVCGSVILFESLRQRKMLEKAKR